MSDETDPVALVVGGGSGIGAALVGAYRTAGTTAVVWDVAGSPDVTCDVAEPGAIDAAVDETRRRWGVPSQVTVTAGVGHARLLTDIEPEEFDRVLRINTRGPLLCMRAWARVMRAEQVAGSFVAVSSISARLVDRSMGLYCASKAALSMLVQVAAAEWGADGLRVNAVAPGVTATPMLGRGASAQNSPWLAGVAGRTALGRLGEAEDIAPVILALHSMAVGHRPGGRVRRRPGPAQPDRLVLGHEGLNPPQGRENCGRLRTAGSGLPAQDCRRSPSQTMSSRSYGHESTWETAAWQVPTTRETTVSAVTSERTEPADWARCNKTPTASRRSALTSAAASSNSRPAPMTAAIRSRLDELNSAMWFKKAKNAAPGSAASA